jgi:hypothetical protein
MGKPRGGKREERRGGEKMHRQQEGWEYSLKPPYGHCWLISPFAFLVRAELCVRTRFLGSDCRELFIAAVAHARRSSGPVYLLSLPFAILSLHFSLIFFFCLFG